MNRFELALENDRWLNLGDFVKFCVDHENQDIIIDVVNEGHCLQYCGVYDILEKFNFSSVSIITSNALEYHPTYCINNKNWIYWLTAIENFNFNFDYSWNRSKLFGCFYGRPSAARLGIASYLLKHHHDKSFLITKFNFTNEESRKHFDLKKLFTWDLDSSKNLFLLENLVLDNETEYIKGKYDQSNSLSKHYKNILIDIVSEPSCAGNAFYPTEKIARAILCRRPFIVMGNKNYLLYLRQMGFLTFWEFWDEDYDGFDQNLRYLKILKLIDNIAMLNQQKIQDLFYGLIPLLEHNFNLLKTQTYQTNITRIIDDY